VPLVVAASALTYALAAASLMAASGRHLPFGRTYAAQLASAFSNRVAPAGVGAMATNVRYLEAAGVPRAAGITAVGLDAVAGLCVHVVAIAVVFTLTGATHQRFHVHSPDLPDQWPLLAAGALGLAALGLVLAGVRRRSALVGQGRAALDQFHLLVKEPVRAVQLIAASAGITATFGLALAASVAATGGGPTLLAVFAVFLGGSAIAAAAPTPGGLGALEAALVAGLTAAGQAAGPAVTAVPPGDLLVAGGSRRGGLLGPAAGGRPLELHVGEPRPVRRVREGTGEVVELGVVEPVGRRGRRGGCCRRRRGRARGDLGRRAVR
jgi:undecaprenyl-diphosphatase